MKKYSKRLFRVGDKVTCIKSFGYGPQVGEIYTVKGFKANKTSIPEDKNYFPILKELSGVTNYWDEEHFVIAKKSN